MMSALTSDGHYREEDIIWRLSEILTSSCRWFIFWFASVLIRHFPILAVAAAQHHRRDSGATYCFTIYSSTYDNDKS
jgi:hypothetical protein